MLDLGPSDVVVDLGCGDAEILCEIATLSGAKKCIGMEISLEAIDKV